MKGGKKLLMMDCFVNLLTFFWLKKKKNAAHDCVEEKLCFQRQNQWFCYLWKCCCFLFPKSVDSIAIRMRLLFVFFSPSSLSFRASDIHNLEKNKPLIDSCCRIFSWRVICCLYFKKRCRWMKEFICPLLVVQFLTERGSRLRYVRRITTMMSLKLL